MSLFFFLGVVGAVWATPTLASQQKTPPPTPPQTADPYANNAAPGATQFPLAAPAGKDSNARTIAPAGAVNQGPFDPSSWKYGPAFMLHREPRSGTRSSCR